MGKIKRPGVVVFASDDSGAARYYIFKRSFSRPAAESRNRPPHASGPGVKRSDGGERREEDRRGDRLCYDPPRDTRGIPCITFGAEQRLVLTFR